MTWLKSVAVIVGLMSFALAGAGSAQPAPLGIAVPITYSFNYDSSLSPDAKRMVFLKVLEGREQMFVADGDGRNERQLTRNPIDHEDPAWSPDGRHIAYIHIDGAKKSLHVMDVDGTNDRRLTPPTQSPIHPAWMPDSAAILYCTDDDLRPPVKNAAEIYRVDVATGKVTTVISGGVNTFPVPSPDGRRIAFRKMLGINSEVFVADIRRAQFPQSHRPSGVRRLARMVAGRTADRLRRKSQLELPGVRDERRRVECPAGG